MKEAKIVCSYLLWAAMAQAAAVDSPKPPKFYPDDPIQAMPGPVPVEEAQFRKVSLLYDFGAQSARPKTRPAAPALAVNTLGEVPDSEWFTNRHAVRRMTREELQRGTRMDGPPVPPFTVTGAKTEGITPGFRMTDSRGRRYFVKVDPVTNPEMATAADVIGANFFYAIGYNTPENYIVRVKPSELTIGKDAQVTGVSGQKRPMTGRDLKSILERAARTSSGEIRVVASLALPGKPIGPFKYEGIRSDDPNDTIPHERRRDLRGLHVFAAWLNHTDAKAGNSLDVLVTENGQTFIKHFLLDFGSMLGSDSDMPKNVRFGNGYIIPQPREALTRILTFGLYTQPWETAKYSTQKELGRLEATAFNPDLWRSNYPNPAFLSRQPDDEYWAAKIVMAFTDDDIRALVETGEYTDPGATGYLTQVLIKRRDTIGQTYFSKVLPLDSFRVEGGELQFTDLRLKYGFSGPRQLSVAWSHYDNYEDAHVPVTGHGTFRLPGSLIEAAAGSYWAARIFEAGAETQAVTVYLRKQADGVRVVGIDRTW
jgi:hypothetical protein